jgi:hypothetical protein
MSKWISFLLLALTFTCEAYPQSDGNQAIWTSDDFKPQYDLTSSYEALLDHFLPTHLIAGVPTKCYLIARFVPHKGNPHQLNVHFSNRLLKNYS